jgi:anti-sigma B factor antagonist
MSFRIRGYTDQMLSPISVEIDTGHPHALVLRVSGEVDISTVGTITRGFTSMLSTRRAGQDLLIIDVSGVGFFGSSGVAALVECQHAAENEALQLRLSGSSSAVLRPLEGTGLIRCFDWYPTLEAALDSPDRSQPRVRTS